MIEPKRARTDANIAEATSGAVVGPPGTGKSWFLGSVLEVYDPEEVLLVCTLPREKDSYFYQKYDVPYVLLWEDYMPVVQSKGAVEATVLPKFAELMVELRDDEKYKFIIVDSGTELAEAGWHYSMLPHGVASPAEMTDGNSRWLPYETLDINLDQVMKAAVGLTLPEIAKMPKHVWFTWHVQAAKEDTSIGNKTSKSADNKAQDIEYEGKILPMIRGKFRRKLQQLLTTFIYADKLITEDPINKKVDVQYVVQVVSDMEKGVKVPGPAPVGDKRLIKGKYMPNDWKTFEPFLREQLAADTESAPKGKKLGTLKK